MALLPAHTDTPKRCGPKTDPKLRQMPTGVRHSDHGFATEIRAESDKTSKKRMSFATLTLRSFLHCLRKVSLQEREMILNSEQTRGRKSCDSILNFCKANMPINTKNRNMHSEQTWHHDPKMYG